MPDPTTPNLVLAQPIRGTDTGVWDIPVNGNTGIIDQAFGSVTTLALSSGIVNLTSSQAQNSVIRLTGTILSHVFIFLPSIYKFWTIDNQLLNSPSSFSAILVSTGASAQGIGLPPGTQDIFYDGTTVNFRNLGNIGQYWDYAGTQVPSWVNVCTKPPYLNCDGTTFSSATYPILANLLGGNTLPDARGRSRFSLNQGIGNITSAGAGIDGNTLLAIGGNNGLTLLSSQIPTLISVNAAQAITVTTVDLVAHGPNSGSSPGGGTQITTSLTGGNYTALGSNGNNSISVTYTNSTQANIKATIPGYIGGITMIRAG